MNGESIFPHPVSGQYSGLSKRELFAIKVLQTLLVDRLKTSMSVRSYTYLAVSIADSLLQELAK